MHYTCIVTQTNKGLRPSSPATAAAFHGRIDRLLDPELFKALGDPTRVTLLACLAKCGRACTVGEVAECCAVDLSVVSRHLAHLARAGILEAEREGRTVLYRVQYGGVSRVLRELADAIDECCPEEQVCVSGACGCTRTHSRKVKP